jgi:Cd2+/Zn2+-exporting ATPase
MKKRHAQSQTLARTTTRFPVEGLDCASCGAELRTNLRSLPGIQSINVNVSASEIAVTFDPTRLDPTTIKTKLESLGLGCSG